MYGGASPKRRDIVVIFHLLSVWRFRSQAPRHRPAMRRADHFPPTTGNALSADDSVTTHHHRDPHDAQDAQVELLSLVPIRSQAKRNSQASKGGDAAEGKLRVCILVTFEAASGTEYPPWGALGGRAGGGGGYGGQRERTRGRNERVGPLWRRGHQLTSHPPPGPVRLANPMSRLRRTGETDTGPRKAMPLASCVVHAILDSCPPRRRRRRRLRLVRTARVDRGCQGLPRRERGARARTCLLADA